MAKYIEREALIEKAKRNKAVGLCIADIVEIYEIIDNVDDVLEVVRCKDCKFHREAHYEDEGEPPYIKHVCGFRKRTVQLDDFCSYGERKETDNGKV